jgi:hypothetical protein
MMLLTGVIGPTGCDIAKLLTAQHVPFHALGRRPVKAAAIKGPNAELVTGNQGSGLIRAHAEFSTSTIVWNSDHMHRSFSDPNPGPQWECNFGVGFGLTPATDRLLVQVIVGYRLALGSGGHRGY